MAIAFFAVIADAVYAGADVAVLAKAARGALLIISAGVIPGIGINTAAVGDDNSRVIFGKFKKNRGSVGSFVFFELFHIVEHSL